MLNLGYFGVEFVMARVIGSVSLFADSIDFLEDATVNGRILIESSAPDQEHQQPSPHVATDADRGRPPGGSLQKRSPIFASIADTVWHWPWSHLGARYRHSLELGQDRHFLKVLGAETRPVMKAINLRTAEELGIHEQQIAANTLVARPRSDCALCCLARTERRD
ncbi:MAG: hypothetical protein WA709_16770 [Stellaceae bacterium]